MVIIGAGRVGGALKDRAEAAGAPCVLIDRAHHWEALDGPSGVPILLAVRNDDLSEVLDRIPAHRLSDVVFLQNGMLRAFLAERGLQGNTRGLLYLAVPRRGDPITPGEVNWFVGPHAQAVAGWFAQLGLDARAVDWPRFTYYELEKLAWLCVFGLLCEAHDETVGEVAEHHADEVEALADELRRVGRAALNVDAPLDHLNERLLHYSRQIPAFRASVKEWPWRDGWVESAARQYGVDTRLHQQWLRKVGKGDLLDAAREAPAE